MREIVQRSTPTKARSNWIDRTHQEQIDREVRKISDRQVALFDLNEYEIDRGVNYGWLEWENTELGTNKTSVPNSPPPAPDNTELGTNKTLVPNSEEWKPQIGCLQQKWIKDHRYWYWRYYDNRGKKASFYLGKDYNRAIRKCQKIGIPTDAKLPNLPPPDPPAKTQPARSTLSTPKPSTAHRASRSTQIG